jgi:hypothetical protein
MVEFNKKEKLFNLKGIAVSKLVLTSSSMATSTARQFQALDKDVLTA